MNSRFIGKWWVRSCSCGRRHASSGHRGDTRSSGHSTHSHHGLVLKHNNSQLIASTVNNIVSGDSAMDTNLEAIVSLQNTLVAKYDRVNNNLI